MKPKVALTKGENRFENTYKSLQLLNDDIDIKGKDNIFIKVNFTSRFDQLGATHVDSVRACLKFLRERYQGKITIAEGIKGLTRSIFDKLGYLRLEKEFGVELFDTDQGGWKQVEVYDAGLHPIKLKRQVAVYQQSAKPFRDQAAGAATADNHQFRRFITCQRHSVSHYFSNPLGSHFHRH